MHCTSLQFGEVARAVLETGSILRFSAKGWSMHPSVRNGDLLLVRAVPESKLGVGDVALCWCRSNRLVVHRVLWKRRQQGTSQFLVKGDRLSDADGWFSGESVLGKVVGIERSGEKIALDNGKHRLQGYLLALVSALNLWQSPLAELIRRQRARLDGRRKPDWRGAG